jgi:hypothetical protein
VLNTPRALLLAACAGLAALPTTAGAAGETPSIAPGYTESREPCRLRSETRNAYFGDLHIHTGFSYDASPLGTHTTPADAYRFARGEAIGIPPYDEAGAAAASMRLARPLDFAAVTDHAEFFGEFALCRDPKSAVYREELCAALRGDGGSSFAFIRVILDEEPQHLPQICGEDGRGCDGAAASVWQQVQTMAEDAYDRSADCSFTSFIGYEYTGTPNANNLHRNVIFRNAQVPPRAASYIDAPRDYQLHRLLQRECLEETPGCDVLSIPHNSNLSAGTMFPRYAGRFASPDEDRERARRRNIIEPIMEIFQHKGNSECFNGLPGIFGAPDELCNMEQMRGLGERFDQSGERYEVEFCAEGETGSRGFQRVGCISPNDFLRSALLNGLQDELALGVNAHRIGVIASTDTHTSVAGATGEREWRGHVVDEAALEQRLEPLTSTPRRLHTNPGGLAGVWAVENSRDALFDAMQRREVFGTSGTRIRPRLFAGWDIATDACSRHDIPAQGYAGGVPMGSDIPRRSQPGPLRFLATALQDPLGAPLQRLQLVKGWIDKAGQSRYEVIDIAGEANLPGRLDPVSGEWRGSGSPSLCTVYEDRDFDPHTPSYYYLRAVEVPSWRWSWAQCMALAEQERPDACSNDAAKTVQEMAWTSPVWYSPGS